MTREQREDFRRRIDLLATPEALTALLRDLKEAGDISETHDLAEEAVMVAGARQITVPPNR